jgi:hypothetical protein
MTADKDIFTKEIELWAGFEYALGKKTGPCLKRC